MTLCIAAKAFNSLTDSLSDGTIVLCCDRRLETPIAQADIGYKWRAISRQWQIMLAGDFPLAVELAGIYEGYFAEEESVTQQQIATIERLRVPLDRLRRRIADQFTQGRFAVSYDELLHRGQSWLGEQIFKETLSELRARIEQEEKSVQALLIGPGDDGFLAIYKYSYGQLWECEDFAAIGSGETIAEAILFYRGLMNTGSLMKAAYIVYEAKRMGEITPGVGESTSMIVSEFKGENLCWWNVTEPGMAFLEGLFIEHFGPKELRGEPALEGFLGGVGASWKGAYINRGSRTKQKLDPGSTTHDPSNQPPN